MRHALTIHSTLFAFALAFAAGALLAPTVASAVPPTPLVHYDFNETGNAPGSDGSERRPLKMRNDAGTALDFHTADGGGVTGLPGDRAFDNTGANTQGSAASGATNGFRADQSDNPALDGLQQFTISGWFKTETNDSLSSTPRLVNNHDGGSGSAGAGFNVQFLSGSDGDLKLDVDDDTGGGVNTTGTPYAAKQTWVFFAVSYDGTTSTNNVNFYVGFRNDTEAGGGPGSADVALVRTASLDRGTVDGESVGLHVGNRPQLDRPFDGWLDEIRIDDSVLDTATLEEVRVATLVAPPLLMLRHVDTASVAISAQDQNAATVSVTELSGVIYDSARGTFWAVSDGSGALLEIDAQFDCDGSFLSASAVSAVSLDDNLDFEGIVMASADSVDISDEGNTNVGEYSLLDGTLLSNPMSIPSIFTSNVRSNRSFEGFARMADDSQSVLAVEHALTVDGPTGTSSTVSTVSRWQLYDAALATNGQVAYEVEPAHDTPVSSTGSGLPDVSFTPTGNLLAVELSEASGEFLVRIFDADLTGASDVSQPPWDDGIGPSEPFTPVSKRLLLSDDRLGKLEDVAMGPLVCGSNLVLLGVVDNGSSNVIHSFMLVPEPGVLASLAAGVVGLLGLRERRQRRRN